MGKIRSEPLRWPDQDSRVLALHELIPNLNYNFFLYFYSGGLFLFNNVLVLRGLKFIEKYPTGLARRKEYKNILKEYLIVTFAKAAGRGGLPFKSSSRRKEAVPVAASI